MDKIEIRQNKKTLIPFLTILLIAFFGMIYYIYFSGKFDNNDTMKVLYIFLSVSLLYAIYIPTRKFLKNEPVLTICNSEIEINEKGKPVSYLWEQIIDWKIEKEDDGGTHYLFLQTAEKKNKINISWLDRRPSEIEEILLKYKKT